jgi:hypothetical protein
MVREELNMFNEAVNTVREKVNMVREGVNDLEGASMTRVGNFRQKNNSAEDGIDGTKSYFRWNSGYSADQKVSEFRSEPIFERANNLEFRSVDQK